MFSQLEGLGAEALKKGGLDFKKVELHAKFCVEKEPEVRTSDVSDQTSKVLRVSAAVPIAAHATSSMSTSCGL